MGRDTKHFMQTPFNLKTPPSLLLTLKQEGGMSVNISQTINCRVYLAHRPDSNNCTFVLKEKSAC